MLSTPSYTLPQHRRRCRKIAQRVGYLDPGRGGTASRCLEQPVPSQRRDVFRKRQGCFCLCSIGGLLVDLGRHLCMRVFRMLQLIKRRTSFCFPVSLFLGTNYLNGCSRTDGDGGKRASSFTVDLNNWLRLFAHLRGYFGERRNRRGTSRQRPSGIERVDYVLAGKEVRSISTSELLRLQQHPWFHSVKIIVIATTLPSRPQPGSRPPTTRVFLPVTTLWLC